jgi:hypothetical protein
MGPFLVVYICIDMGDDIDDDDHDLAWVRVFVYSSKTCQWRQRAYLQVPCWSIDDRPFVLVAEAFYSFVRGYPRAVIKYDLVDNSLSRFNVPPMVEDWATLWIPPCLVMAEDGGLGLAHLDKFSLHTWS